MNNTFVPVNCARRKTDWNTLSPAESAIATDIITSRAFDGIVKDDEAFTGPAICHLTHYESEDIQESDMTVTIKQKGV